MHLEIIQIRLQQQSENLLVEKQANWKQNAVFGQNCRGSTHEKAQNMTNECSFSALSSYVFFNKM